MPLCKECRDDAETTTVDPGGNDPTESQWALDPGESCSRCTRTRLR